MGYVKLTVDGHVLEVRRSPAASVPLLVYGLMATIGWYVLFGLIFERLNVPGWLPIVVFALPLLGMPFWIKPLAAAAGWLLLALLAVLESARRKALVHRAARFGAAMGSQSLVQLCLFFSAPFFFRAASIPSHWAFVALLLAAGAVTLWTPLSEAALRHSVAGTALLGLATLAGLDCV